MNIDREQFLAALLATGLGAASAACGGSAEPVEETAAPPAASGSEMAEPMATSETDMGMEGEEEETEEVESNVAPTVE